LTGYKSDIILSKYGDSLNQKIEIEYSIGTVEDQTGRRLSNAYEKLDDYFLLLYGDNYWPIELNQMLNLYNEKNAKVSTTVFSNKQGTGEYGYENNIEVGKDNFVNRYDKKRKSGRLNGVDMGYFIVNRSAIDPNSVGNISFEEAILPKLASERQLVAYVTDAQYHYITDMNSLKNFESVVVKEDIKPIQSELFKRTVKI